MNLNMDQCVPRIYDQYNTTQHFLFSTQYFLLRQRTSAHLHPVKAVFFSLSEVGRIKVLLFGKGAKSYQTKKF